MEDKYQYTVDFQESILKFTVKSQDGYKALNLFEPEYFDLIEHQVIAQTLKSHFKKTQRIPSTPSTLKELCQELYTKRDWSKAITKEDKGRVTKLVTKLYRGVAKDGEDILDKCIKFSQYITLTHIIEDSDLSDFSAYDPLLNRIQKAINIGTDLDNDAGTFVLKDINTRQIERKVREPIKNLPWPSLDALTNANGYYKNAIITLVDKGKGFKTGFLANVAISYLKKRKNVIIFDLENGEDSFSMRVEQSIAGINKLSLLSGDYDQKIKKTFRRWRRLKDDRGQPIELVIKRLPALSTINDMQYWIDYYKKEHGIVFQYVVIDYIALMGSTSKAEDETKRISDAYIDIKNFTSKNNFDHTWTAHHVKREAEKRRETRYEPSDLAKCIDIHRHVDMLIGINQNKTEEEAGISRLEVIDQRDGPRYGHAYFFLSQEIQRVKPLNKEQAKEFDEINQELRSNSDKPHSDNNRKPLNDDV